MTQYSAACYFARQAADLNRMRGLSVSGFSRLPEALHGAIWQFIHADSGLVILLNSSGAVNAKATKAARDIAKAADLARLVKSAKEAQALAAEIDSALADLDSAEKPAADLAPAAFDPAPSEVYQPGEKTPADHKAAARAFIWAFALAPIAPALESPLLPRLPALRALAALSGGF